MRKAVLFLESIQRYWKRTDKTYLLLCILSSSFAVLALSSWAAKQGSGFALDDVTGQIVGVGDYRRAVVQAGAAAIGLCVAVLLSNIDYRSLVKVWPVHVAVTWGMVLPTLFIRNVTVGPLTIGYNAGDTDNYSWYKLGGFTLQPTELAKISFILTFAMHLNNVRGKINEPKELGKLLLHMLVPILIIHIQGDDGTAIIYGIIACCMMFIRNVTVGPLTIGYNAGDTDNYSWYKLGGFTLQPTELAKISFILTFAMHLNNVRGKINEPKELGKLLLHMLVPILIIHIQGDDGTAIIYGIIACCMMFSAGLSWKYIIGAISAAAAAVAVAFGFFSDKIGKGYQWYRILAVIDPENKTGWAPSETVWKNIIYQQQRGEIALGSGGIFGNGIFSGSYYSVPNAHNDFVFSWIGNVTGFVGCCVVLGILFALVCKTFATGARSEDMLGSFICAGIGGALMAQIAVNVGMNLRVLPVIGVTLPFYSAGGSSVLMLYICVGLVLSVYMHNTKKLFG